MKKIFASISILFVAFVAMVATNGCRELAQNGDFSGQWQVLSIDYPDGTTVDPEGTRYYCIYRDVVQLTSQGSERKSGNLVYDEDARKCSMEFPYEEAQYLAPWGITFPADVAPTTKGCTIHFTIQTLTESRLVMTSEMGVVITCRKW